MLSIVCPRVDRPIPNQPTRGRYRTSSRGRGHNWRSGSSNHWKTDDTDRGGTHDHESICHQPRAAHDDLCGASRGRGRDRSDRAVRTRDRAVRTRRCVRAAADGWGGLQARSSPGNRGAWGAEHWPRSSSWRSTVGPLPFGTQFFRQLIRPVDDPRPVKSSGVPVCVRFAGLHLIEHLLSKAST